MIQMTENRNARGEDVAKFTAEMMKLAKRPEMKPFLTSTEVARQAKEKEAEAQAEKERKEAEAIEIARRDHIIADWFDINMLRFAPDTWLEFQATKNKRVMSKAKWRLIAENKAGAPEGYTPVPVTICTIWHKGKVKLCERLVWAEPKPIKGKILMPGISQLEEVIKQDHNSGERGEPTKV